MIEKFTLPSLILFVLVSPFHKVEHISFRDFDFQELMMFAEIYIINIRHVLASDSANSVAIQTHTPQNSFNCLCQSKGDHFIYIMPRRFMAMEN